MEASAPYLPTGDDFPKSSVDRVPNEPKFSEPKSQHITCALDPSNPTGGITDSISISSLY